MQQMKIDFMHTAYKKFAKMLHGNLKWGEIVVITVKR